jgi:osmotically-inducible protein OsmY
VVRLKGTVESWTQREAAEHAAGSAPGIARIDNQLLVEPPHPHDLDEVEEIC